MALQLVWKNQNLSQAQNVGVIAAVPNYDEVVQLLNLPQLTGSERIEQVISHEEQLRSLFGAKLIVVTLDQDGLLVLGGDRPIEHLQTSEVTDLKALTFALAAGIEPNLQPSQSNQIEKIVENHAQLTSLVDQYRNAGQKLVFTNGCFDILHPGHVTYLQQAKALGDILIVGVNSDQSVKGLKGAARPINPLGDRLIVLSGLASVDYVVPFTQPTPLEIIKIVRPDIYVKGGDYTPETLPEAPIVQELGGVVKILPFVSDRSTTSIINRICKADN